MLVTLKTTGGLELKTSSLGKPYTLRGWGYINNIPDSVWSDIYKSNQTLIDRMLQGGFIATSKGKEASVKNSSDDLLQSVADKQELAMKNNQKQSGVKLTKE